MLNNRALPATRPKPCLSRSYVVFLYLGSSFSLFYLSLLSPSLAPAKVLSSDSVLIVVAVTRSRYGRKDKRPLDPPPVVQVKCYQIARQGSAEQGGREFDTYE